MQSTINQVVDTQESHPDKIITLKEREWAITDTSSDSEYLLNLMACSGIVAYPTNLPNRGDLPLLIVHARPFVIRIPFHDDLNINMLFHTPEFNDADGNEGKMSLSEILNNYKSQIRDKCSLEKNPKLGIYLASGARIDAFPVDLLLGLYFSNPLINNSQYSLYDYRLDKPTRMLVGPKKGVISFFNISDSSISGATLVQKIGKNYNGANIT